MEEKTKGYVPFLADYFIDLVRGGGEW